jgi:hypothetical protein
VSLRFRLILAFSAILVVMIWITVRASLVRSVFDNGHLLVDPWALATLVDAYAGFLTFFCWVAYKERRALPRTLWFVAIMALGNIAMSLYVLIHAVRLREGEGAVEFLLRRDEES